MSLRLRFTAIAALLLAGVLAGCLWWISRQERRIAETSIQQHMEVLARRAAPTDRLTLAEREAGKAEPEAMSDALREARDLPVVVEYYAPAGGPSPFGEGPVHIRYSTEREPPTLGRRTPQPPDADGPLLEQVRLEGGSHYVAVFNLPVPVVGEGPGRRRGGPRRGPRRGGEDGGFEEGGRPRPPARDGDGRPPRQGPDDGRRPRPGARIFDAVVAVPVDMALERFGYDERLRDLGLIGLVSLVLGSGLAWLLSGAMVRPLSRTARAAETIDRVSQRLPAPRGKDELARLTNVLNGMLSRLEAGHDRERRFLATASHELRRPLAALTAELELATRSDRSAHELWEALALALGDARSMGRLVDDLLDQARARAGTLKIREGNIDIVDMLASSSDRAQRASRKAGGTIVLGKIPDGQLLGDAQAIGRIIENLISNALAYGGDGVRVQLRARIVEDGIAIEVRDDGPGISPAAQSSIFEPFGRGDEVRSESGTGLGLAIARQLAHAHDGRLSVQSPVSKEGGTCFTLWLPKARWTPSEFGYDTRA